VPTLGSGLTTVGEPWAGGWTLVALQCTPTWEHHTAAAAGGMITLICMSVSLCPIERKVHVVPDFHLAAAMQRVTSLAQVLH
jgi:hypothetical protein